MKTLSVSVAVDGETILTIETSMLSGKANLTSEDEEAIRSAAAQLLSFVGPVGAGAFHLDA